MQRFENYLGNMDQLTTESRTEKSTYIHPALKNLGTLSVVLLREAVAPVVFRNAEQEITDIEINGEAHVRAIPNKFKYPEKSRGLQILRAFGVGGRQPQNKTIFAPKQKVSEVYDLNTFVFGDSAVHDGRVLSVKSGMIYSDGLSILPKYKCVDETFHNRASEDGSLFDAENKKSSDNLFTRHFIVPGTLMVQVISTVGRLQPLQALDHLLLSLGVAGAYGGQTSVTGTNIRTHMVGIYAARFERPLASPYEIVKELQRHSVDGTDAAKVCKELHPMLAKVHEQSMAGSEATVYQTDLVARFETNDSDLKIQYQQAAEKVGNLFDNWFGTGK
jgi:CRISPR type I-D-associated protein Csc2